jgi:hypothetical protein
VDLGHSGNSARHDGLRPLPRRDIEDRERWDDFRVAYEDAEELNPQYPEARDLEGVVIE